VDADREKLAGLLVAELGRAPVEALIDQHPDVDWGGLAGQMTATKKELQAELATAEPGSAREAELRTALGLPPRPPPPEIGDGKVGGQMKALMDAVEIPPCQQCIEDAAEMDRIGVAEVRRRFDEFLSRIKPRAKKLGWRAKAKAFRLAWKQNLPLTPRGMLTLAINRAEGRDEFSEDEAEDAVE
jgi:hypothetical protein